MKHMKWWGWGEEGVSFRHDDRPAFAALMKTAIDIDVTKGPAAVADLDSVRGPRSGHCENERRAEGRGP